MDKVQVLQKFMPAEAAPIIARWIDYFNCEFKVSRNRDTKYGDYRAPANNKGHRISVNYNLNSYAFLITTVHEFAHLLTWNEHKRNAKPHGAEWKSNFKRMMAPFFERQVFPNDIKEAIANYLKNPSASSCTDLGLFRVLKRYDDKPSENSIHIEQLPLNSVFSTKNGRVFRKESLLKKRFRCIELKTGLVYLFNPLAEVVVLQA